MRLLSIETATAACSVALTIDGETRQRSETGARVHARVLLPWTRELLAEAGLGFADLDAVAVDRGPGGFTSLRLGLGVAQGIALAHDLPAHAVSSLAALAHEAQSRQSADEVLAVLDARMDEVYAARFAFDNGRPVRIGEEWLGSPETLPIPERGTVHGAGSGFAEYGGRLSARLGERLASVDPDAAPSARGVAELAVHVAPVAGHELEPVYLRDRVTG